MRSTGGRFLLYLVLVAGGILLGLTARALLPGIFESTGLFVALVLLFLVLGLALFARAIWRSRGRS